MHNLNVDSYPADTEVWMRPAMKADGLEYYKYFLLYTNDALVISKNGEYVIREHIAKYFELTCHTLSGRCYYS